eukprot:349995-Prorocentrum_minimum.AAC.2
MDQLTQPIKTKGRRAIRRDSRGHVDALGSARVCSTYAASPAYAASHKRLTSVARGSVSTSAPSPPARTARSVLATALRAALLRAAHSAPATSSPRAPAYLAAGRRGVQSGNSIALESGLIGRVVSPSGRARHGHTVSVQNWWES